MTQPRKEQIGSHPHRNVVSADVRAGVRMDSVFHGYFSSAEMAGQFIAIGLANVLSQFPKKITFADFGGGDGFLAKTVQTYLESHGKRAQGIVVDANQQLLQRAEQTGLTTLLANLEDVHVQGLDLIVMRAVLHYNSPEAQSNIIERVKASLKANGVFVNQISSGDPFNVRLRNEINQLPSLGRKTHDGSPHFVTKEEYVALCHARDFPTVFVGYAPPNQWTPEELFDRFHPETHTMTGEEKMRYPPRTAFLKECLALIAHYQATTPIEGIEASGTTVNVQYQYPIFVSRFHPEQEPLQRARRSRSSP